MTDDLETIQKQLSQAFYEHNPYDYADSISDLLPLITTPGARWCPGSNQTGHPDGMGRVTCRACGATLSAARRDVVLPHWAWTFETVQAAAEDTP